jgi:hypothetical protein
MRERLGLLSRVDKVFQRTPEAQARGRSRRGGANRRALNSATYWATTAVPANWQRPTPAIEYSSARNAMLTELDPVGER